ncbi:hypothetical protein L0128_03975 [candidate division KSB1 bacterium]|nr:hypothetical protein [candidate division KSB1 bacterium]
MPIKKHKYRGWFLSSWLMAKLLGPFELTRQMVGRFFPRARIQKIRLLEKQFTTTEWVYQAPDLFNIVSDATARRIILKKVAKISKN